MTPKEKAKEILYKHAKSNGCKSDLLRNPFLQQAVLNAINEALTIPAVSGSCFGRISENVFSDLKSLDDLITKMGTTKDGCKNIGVGEPYDFKSRLRYFKEFLKKELPEFTEEDILKFDKHFQKFRKIYGWNGAEYFLTAMEYEIRNNLKKLS